MSILTAYHSASRTSSTRPRISADLGVVILWSLLGLGFSAVCLGLGYGADSAFLQAFVW